MKQITFFHLDRKIQRYNFFYFNVIIFFIFIFFILTLQLLQSRLRSFLSELRTEFFYREKDFEFLFPTRERNFWFHLFRLVRPLLLINVDDFSRFQTHTHACVCVAENQKNIRRDFYFLKETNDTKRCVQKSTIILIILIASLHSSFKTKKETRIVHLFSYQLYFTE